MATEPMYLSDLNLPKELSKKKKFNLMFAHYIKDEKQEITDLEFNKEDQLVFFSVEEAIKHEIIRATSGILDIDSIRDLSSISLDVVNGLMVVVNIEIDAATLNAIPIRVDVRNNALNPEFNPDNLSMHISMINKNPNDYTMKISYIKVTESEYKTDKNGIIGWKSLKFMPIIHTS